MGAVGLQIEQAPDATLGNHRGAWFAQPLLDGVWRFRLRRRLVAPATDQPQPGQGEQEQERPCLAHHRQPRTII